MKCPTWYFLFYKLFQMQSATWLSCYIEIRAYNILISKRFQWDLSCYSSLFKNILWRYVLSTWTRYAVKIHFNLWKTGLVLWIHFWISWCCIVTCWDETRSLLYHDSCTWIVVLILKCICNMILSASGTLEQLISWIWSIYKFKKALCKCLHLNIQSQKYEPCKNVLRMLFQHLTLGKLLWMNACWLTLCKHW